MTGICATCKTERPVSDFPRDRSRSAGFRAKCRSCKSAYDQARYAKKATAIKQRVVEYQRVNPDKVAQWRENRAPAKAVADRAYQRANAAKISAYLKDYSARWRREKRHLNCAKAAAYRARKLMAMPRWLTQEHLDQLAAIYAACPAGYHVDHIYPLKGEGSCGLHVPWNLQYLPAVENLRKSNKVL